MPTATTARKAPARKAPSAPATTAKPRVSRKAVAATLTVVPDVPDVPVRAPRRKAPAKVSAPVAAVEPAPASNGGRPPAPRSALGFADGSNADIAARALVAGGLSRTAITNQLRDADNGVTSQGNKRNWSAIVSVTYDQMLEMGFVPEASFRMVPPEVITPAPPVKKVTAQKSDVEVVPEPAPTPIKRTRKAVKPGSKSSSSASAKAPATKAKSASPARKPAPRKGKA